MIAIVAVLTALLLPAISRVRAQSDQARCIANLKQLHLAVQSYANEHNGKVPAGNSGPANNPGGPLDNWLVVLRPYIEVKQESKTAIDNVLSCPAARREYDADTFTATYGYNAMIISTDSSNNSRSQMRTVNIPKPARTCLIMDGKNAWEGRATSPSAFWMFQVSGNPASRPAPRDFVHSGKANVLFCDGHIELLGNEDIPEGNTSLFWDPQAAE